MLASRPRARTGSHKPLVLLFVALHLPILHPGGRTYAYKNILAPIGTVTHRHYSCTTDLLNNAWTDARHQSLSLTRSLTSGLPSYHFHRSYDLARLLLSFLTSKSPGSLSQLLESLDYRFQNPEGFARPLFSVLRPSIWSVRYLHCRNSFFPNSQYS